MQNIFWYIFKFLYTLLIIVWILSLTKISLIIKQSTAIINRWFVSYFVFYYHQSVIIHHPSSIHFEKLNQTQICFLYWFACILYTFTNSMGCIGRSYNWTVTQIFCVKSVCTISSMSISLLAMTFTFQASEIPSKLFEALPYTSGILRNKLLARLFY